MSIFRNKTYSVGPYINKWQDVLFANMGLSEANSNETIKESCRKILLATSKLYENVIRIEEGFKPIE